jgi:hypothetical protein
MYKFTCTWVTHGESRWICHVIENKHEDKCMQNLKHNGDLGSIRRFRCPKPLFNGAKGFVHATKKGNAFFNYVFPSLDVEHVHMKFLPSTKNSRMCLKNKMQTPCPNINHVDCTIDLEEGAQLPFEPIYNLSQYKLVILHEYIDKNLEKGFI